MTADIPSPPARPATARERTTLALVRLLLALPYRLRVRLAGAFGRVVLGRLTSMGRRMSRAVQHYLPGRSAAEARRIGIEASGNMARLVIEVLSGTDLRQRASQVALTGPGLAALEAARDSGRPAILVSGHFGNYEAMRVALIARGFPVCGYYKDFAIPAMTRLYLDSAGAAGQPLFADTPEGLKGMIRFLKTGGMLGILIDLDRPNGVMLDFLGQPTRTVLSMAELALRYDALLVPVWGLRMPGQPGFRVQIDAPVPPSDPRTMTQALNDAFGAQVRAHPGQWVWWHRRRKGLGG